METRITAFFFFMMVLFALGWSIHTTYLKLELLAAQDMIAKLEFRRRDEMCVTLPLSMNCQCAAPFESRAR